MPINLQQAPDGTAGNTYAALKTVLNDNFTQLQAALSQVSSIGVAGEAGFGVGICPEELPTGMVKLEGTTTVGHDNYGNYQYSDGSIMCCVPAFVYKYGTGSNGLAANEVDIKDLTEFASVVAANNAGYALHRAFYDGGEIKSCFFVDKYLASNNSGTASSVQNGAPLSSHPDHNPFADLDGSPSNNYAGALAAAQTRGVDFFCNSRFIFAALALLSLAHGNAATAATSCAWYDSAGITNIPKGCNNNALGDTNDVAVSYTTDGYSNCGLTGSGTPFAKTTHNGQTCGVADLNGDMNEVNTGITCIATSMPITGVAYTNPCLLTVVGHGLDSGAHIQVVGVGGTTQLNDRIYSMTVVDQDTVSLDDVDATAFDVYTSGGSVVYGAFYALKTDTACKNLTGGNTLATDHWGAVGVAANFNELDINLATAYPDNAFVQRWGNANNQVIPEDDTGNSWMIAGSGLPETNGVAPSGSNQFGTDYFYQYIRNEVCLRAGGSWSNGSGAGVWSLNLSHARGYSNNNVGFRAALYL